MEESLQNLIKGARRAISLIRKYVYKVKFHLVEVSVNIKNVK